MSDKTVKLCVSKALRYSGEPFLYATLNEKPITEKVLDGYMKAELISEDVSLERIKNALNVDIPSEVVSQKVLILKAKNIIEALNKNKTINSYISKNNAKIIEQFLEEANEVLFKKNNI